MKTEIVFILEQYFIDNSNFIELLDTNNIQKQSSRFHIFVSTSYKENQFFIPLRSNIKHGSMGFSAPSSTRPNAGLDYRKALIVNDDKYIHRPNVVKIPSSQRNHIQANIVAINNGFSNYVNGYIKSANKKREHIDSKYKFSTLHNFHKELGICKNP